MTVQNLTTSVSYSGDGSTVKFPVTFEFNNDSSYVKVKLVDSNSVETELSSGYVVIDGNVFYPECYAYGLTTNTPLQTGNKITIYRETPRTQDKVLGAIWPFNSIEAALDKLTMAMQDVRNKWVDITDNLLTVYNDVKAKHVTVVADYNTVVKDTAQVATNAAQVATNAAQVATNTEKVAANTAQVATNTEKVNSNTETVVSSTNLITKLPRLKAITCYIGESNKLVLEQQPDVTDGNIYIYAKYIMLRGYKGVISTDPVTSVAADWSTFQSDINDSTRFVTSPGGVTNCLCLAGSEALVYDISTKKFVIGTYNTWKADSQFLLAVQANGTLQNGAFLEIWEYQNITKLRNIPDIVGRLSKIAGITSYVATGNKTLTVEQYPIVTDNKVYLYAASVAVRGYIGNPSTGYQTSLNIPWATLMTYINDSTRFVTSPGGVANCLCLASSEALVYDVTTQKYSIGNYLNWTADTQFLMALNINGSLVAGALLDVWEYQQIKALNATTESLDSKVRVLENDSSGLADYAIENIKNVAATVEALQTPKTLSFAFITDTHFDSNGNSPFNLSANHHKAVGEISNYVYLDFILHGGDMVQGYNTKTNTLADIHLSIKDMRKYAKCPVLVTKGNHDDNSYYIYYQTDKTPTQLITPQNWYNTVTRTFKDDVVATNATLLGGYYYKDFADQNIRVIFLNTCDTPIMTDTNGNLVYYPIKDYTYSDAQIKWLVNTALDIPAGYSILICQHIPVDQSASVTHDGGINNGDVVRGILGAAKNGTSYSCSATTGNLAHDAYSVDYTGNAKDIIAIISGHTHCDKFTTVNGIKNITTVCSKCEASTEATASLTIPSRTAGTNTEDSWVIFTVDPDQRTIYATRYGAGEDFNVIY